MHEINSNHTVIIGASSGLGRELAVRLSDIDNLSLFSRRVDKLEEISFGRDNVFFSKLDVSNSDEIEASLLNAVSKHGKISRLIYCAGEQIIMPHRMMNMSDFDLMYLVNLRGAVAVSKVFCRSTISEAKATMCVISSIAAVKPEPGILGYSVVKSGLNSLVKALALECKPRRFVGVAPAWLDTDMTRKQVVYTADFIEKLNAKTPLGLISLDCVVDTVEFLISNKAKSITGQIITIDGGYTL